MANSVVGSSSDGGSGKSAADPPNSTIIAEIRKKATIEGNKSPTSNNEI